MMTNDNKNKNLVMGVICKMFQKYIWDCKLRHTLPVTWHAKLTIKKEFELLMDCSKKIQTSAENIAYQIISEQIFKLF